MTDVQDPAAKAREILDGWGFVEAHPQYPILRDKIAAALEAEYQRGMKDERKTIS